MNSIISTCESVGEIAQGSSTTSVQQHVTNITDTRVSFRLWACSLYSLNLPKSNFKSPKFLEALQFRDLSLPTFSRARDYISIIPNTKHLVNSTVRGDDDLQQESTKT